jgi:hypothetical protein
VLRRSRYKSTLDAAPLPEVGNEFTHGLSPQRNAALTAAATSEPSNSIERCIASVPSIAKLLISDQC